MSDNTAAALRPTLGFAFEGLSGRDETLFKAIVRLLDHRTQQRWVHRPGSPDVCVVGDSGFGPDAVADAEVVAPNIDAPPPLRLTISATPHGEHCLRLPIRADALEAELNSLGVERVRTCGMTLSPMSSGNAVQLRRWPPAYLLGTAERVRLATLMLSKPVTLAWVQQRAGTSSTVCAQFFAELHDAGLLSGSQTPADVVPVEVRADAVAPAVRPAAAPVVPTGLFALIRSRLGLLARASAS